MTRAPDLVRGLGEGAVVAQPPSGGRVLDEDAEDVAVARRRAQRRGGPHVVEVGDDHGQAERDGPGAQHAEGLGEDGGVDEQHGVVGDLRRAAHEGHRLGGGRPLVEEGGPGRGEAGEVGDDGLEVEQRLEPALGDLRLVGRVRRVPGRVLQDVALDDRRGDRAVVPQPDERGEHGVAGGDLAQLGDDGRLGGGGLDRQLTREADAAGHGGVDEVVEAGAADGLEHPGEVALAGADVAGGEVGQRWRAHERSSEGQTVWSSSPSVESRGSPEVPVPSGPLRLRGSGECCPFGAPTGLPGTLPHGVSGGPNLPPRDGGGRPGGLRRGARRAGRRARHRAAARRRPRGRPARSAGPRACPRPRARPCRRRCRTHPGHPGGGR